MAIAVAKKKYQIWIVVISILIPLVVALLLFMPKQTVTEGGWIYFLPHINAVINSITSILLVWGFILIKKNHRRQHKNAMIAAFVLGTLFLVSYVTYHASAPSTKFGDLNGDGVLAAAELTRIGIWRYVYLAVLLSHILLAIIVVPFVLLAMYHALVSNFEKHKKVTRFAFPIWLYVSVSGVIVYLMISPYY